MKITNTQGYTFQKDDVLLLYLSKVNISLNQKKREIALKKIINILNIIQQYSTIKFY